MLDLLDHVLPMVSPLLTVASAVFFGLALLRWLIGPMKKGVGVLEIWGEVLSGVCLNTLRKRHFYPF